MSPKTDANKTRRKRTVTVGARYPADRAALLEALQHRWGHTEISPVVREAYDRLLREEGFDLPEAA